MLGINLDVLHAKNACLALAKHRRKGRIMFVRSLSINCVGVVIGFAARIIALAGLAVPSLRADNAVTPSIEVKTNTVQIRWAADPSNVFVLKTTSRWRYTADERRYAILFRCKTGLQADRSRGNCRDRNFRHRIYCELESGRRGVGIQA